jgi:hypothetical protein
MHTLNLEQLKATTLAGGVTGITLRGDGAAFVVSVQTLRDQPRRFADPRKALQVLRSTGWNECHVDASQWRPEDSALEKTTRPDRSVALKAAHEAAEHKRWFDAKVQASIDGLKDGTNRAYSPEEWAARRAEIMARFSGTKTA